MLPYCSAVWDLHCHCIPKPLSSATPHGSSLRPGQLSPAVCHSAQILADTSSPCNYTESTPFFSTAPALITCLWVDGGLGLTAGSLWLPSLPPPSAWWAQGKWEEQWRVGPHVSASQPAILAKGRCIQKRCAVPQNLNSLSQGRPMWLIWSI